MRELVRGEQPAQHTYRHLEQVDVLLLAEAQPGAHPLDGEVELGREVHQVQRVQRVDDGEAHAVRGDGDAAERVELVVAPRVPRVPTPRVQERRAHRGLTRGLGSARARAPRITAIGHAVAKSAGLRLAGLQRGVGRLVG